MRNKLILTCVAVAVAVVLAGTIILYEKEPKTLSRNIEGVVKPDKPMTHEDDTDDQGFFSAKSQNSGEQPEDVTGTAIQSQESESHWKAIEFEQQIEKLFAAEVDNGTFYFEMLGLLRDLRRSIDDHNIDLKYLEKKTEELLALKDTEEKGLNFGVHLANELGTPKMLYALSERYKSAGDTMQNFISKQIEVSFSATSRDEADVLEYFQFLEAEQNKQIVNSAIIGLGTSGNEKVVEELGKRINDLTMESKNLWLESLSHSHKRAKQDAALAQFENIAIQSSDPEIFTYYLNALAWDGNKSSIQRIFDFINDGSSLEENEEVVTALKNISYPAAIDEVRNIIFFSNSTSQRRVGLKAYGKYWSRINIIKVTQDLEKIITDSDVFPPELVEDAKLYLEKLEPGGEFRL